MIWSTSFPTDFLNGKEGGREGLSSQNTFISLLGIASLKLLFIVVLLILVPALVLLCF